MGTTGTGLFADDIACDVRDQFIASLRAGHDPVESTSAMIREYGDRIDDVDEGPVFWLALAATQWKYGCLGEEVRMRALEVIDNGADVARWTGGEAARRQKMLAVLRAQLESEQPRFRRPRRQAAVVTPSVKIPSPDCTAYAVAYELGKSTHPGAPKMQVYLQTSSNGAWGGGNVAVADCTYDQITLTWIASDTLQIGHPASAVFQSAAKTSYYSGRTINIVYSTDAR